MAFSGCGVRFNRSPASALNSVPQAPGAVGLHLSAPPFALKGQCTTALTASIAAPQQEDLTLSLQGAGQGAFFSDSSCHTPVTTLDIPVGATGATFYLKDSTAESLSLQGAALAQVGGTSQTLGHVVSILDVIALPPDPVGTSISASLAGNRQRRVQQSRFGQA